MSEKSRWSWGPRFAIVFLPNVLYFVILVIALILTLYFPQIPWQLLPITSVPYLWIPWYLMLVGGTLLLILGVMFVVWGITSMGRQRAAGSEINLSRRASTLITTGAYSYCRHPQTLGFILATPAIALLFDFAPLLLVALIYTPLQLALLGYEEVELLRRLGEPYASYRDIVPFIIPRGKRTIPA